MACAVCEHCHSPIIDRDILTFHEGFSYHKECYKCYVCSETNLHNAEVFKGVIFCYACAKRIFQGCASARKTKQQANNRLKNSRSKSRGYIPKNKKSSPSKRSKPRDSSRKSRSSQRRKRERSRLPEPRLETNFNGVIERAQMGGSTTDSVQSRGDKTMTISSIPPVVTETLQLERNCSYSNLSCKTSQPTHTESRIHPTTNFKKPSAEIGVTTEVTQQLLQEINDFMQPAASTPPTPTKPATKPKAPCPTKKRELQRVYKKKNYSPRPHRPHQNKHVCSDLRMAELGVSTEIANMALRKKSEVPVIIKSEHQLNEADALTYSISIIEQESEGSVQESLDSAYSTLSGSMRPNCLDRRLRSIIKLPYKYFKKNILERSSLISLLMHSKQDPNPTLLEKLKMIFYEEVTEHRGRGMRRLYSTINRRKKAYKLGWIDYNAAVTGLMSGGKCITDSARNRRCKHLNSHSYRCMRAQVMRLAGPTGSQLACFRQRLKSKKLRRVLKNIGNFFVGPGPEPQPNNYELQTVFQSDAAKPAPTTSFKGPGHTYFHLYSMLTQ